MKKLVVIAMIALGFSTSMRSIDLAQALVQLEAAQSAINAIPANITAIRSGEPMLKLMVVSELLSNLSQLSGPLAETITSLNQNKIASKFIPRQLVQGVTELNKGIQAAAGAL